jgi:hypothetical protein
MSGDKVAKGGRDASPVKKACMSLKSRVGRLSLSVD